jgi:hypothetical protein
MHEQQLERLFAPPQPIRMGSTLVFGDAFIALS